MATFRICVFKHQKRGDNKYPVSIRVYWRRSMAYINTGLYVSSSQIRITKKTFEVKDPFIIDELNNRIRIYEGLKVSKLGYNIELYTARDLAKYFQKEGVPGTDSTIDFIAFSRLHCQRLFREGRHATAKSLQSVLNAVIDFCGGREKIYVSEINIKFIREFDLYLRSTRTMKRINQHGRQVTIKRGGASDISVLDYITRLRILFNAAKNEYNDEEKGEIRIMHSPFRKYEFRKGAPPQKRVITVEQVVLIRDIKNNDLIYKRARIARDIFMLSFYLGGINTVDLYSLVPEDLCQGRLSYCRQKTKARRQDHAFISVKVFPEALLIIQQYKDPTGKRLLNFYHSYSSSHIFVSNINKGLKYVAQKCKIQGSLTTYYARFSFASIARNKCEVSKDDIDLALNHVDQSMRMADRYIEKDWSRVDNVISKVIEVLG